MKNQMIFLFSLSLVLFITSCNKDDPEVLGCMDPDSLNYDPLATEDDGTCEYLADKLIGKWEVDKFKIQSVDYISAGWLKDVEFDFESNNDFEWSGEGLSGTFFRGFGSWELDGDEIEIEFDSNSDYFCEGSLTDHDFEFDFNETYTELELEDESACNDGGESGLEIVMDK